MSTTAWVARDPEEGCAVVVYADTRGRAKVRGHAGLQEFSCSIEFCDVRVKREPKWDGEREPSRRDLFNDGWFFTCNGCEARVDNETDPAPTWLDDERVVCADCMAAGRVARRDRGLAEMARGEFVPESVVRERFPLQQAVAALEGLRERKERGR